MRFWCKIVAALTLFVTGSVAGRVGWAAGPASAHTAKLEDRRYVVGPEDGGYRAEWEDRAHLAGREGSVHPAGSDGGEDRGGAGEAAWDRLQALGVLPVGAAAARGSDRNVTRGEFAILAVRLAGLAATWPGAVTAEPASRQVLADVPPDHPAAAALHTAHVAGLVRGYPDGTFRPDLPITQAEAATVLIRVLGYERVVREPWPLGHLRQAAVLGLVPATGPAPEDVLTWRDAARMADAALRTERLRQVTFGALERWEPEPGGTLLRDVFRTLELKGVRVVATPQVAEGELEPDQMTVDLGEGIGLRTLRWREASDVLSGGVLSVERFLFEEVTLWVRDAEGDGLSDGDAIVYATVTTPPGRVLAFDVIDRGGMRLRWQEGEEPELAWRLERSGRWRSVAPGARIAYNFRLFDGVEALLADEREPSFAAAARALAAARDGAAGRDLPVEGGARGDDAGLAGSALTGPGSAANGYTAGRFYLNDRGEIEAAVLLNWSHGYLVEAVRTQEEAIDYRDGSGRPGTLRLDGARYEVWRAEGNAGRIGIRTGQDSGASGEGLAGVPGARPVRLRDIRPEDVLYVFEAGPDAYMLVAHADAVEGRLEQAEGPGPDLGDYTLRIGRWEGTFSAHDATATLDGGEEVLPVTGPHRSLRPLVEEDLAALTDRTVRALLTPLGEIRHLIAEGGRAGPQYVMAVQEPWRFEGRETSFYVRAVRGDGTEATWELADGTELALIGNQWAPEDLDGDGVVAAGEGRWVSDGTPVELPQRLRLVRDFETAVAPHIRPGDVFTAGVAADGTLWRLTEVDADPAFWAREVGRIDERNRRIAVRLPGESGLTWYTVTPGTAIFDGRRLEAISWSALAEADRSALQVVVVGEGRAAEAIVVVAAGEPALRGVSVGAVRSRRLGRNGTELVVLTGEGERVLSTRSMDVVQAWGGGNAGTPVGTGGRVEQAAARAAIGRGDAIYFTLDARGELEEVWEPAAVLAGNAAALADPAVGEAVYWDRTLATQERNTHFRVVRVRYSDRLLELLPATRWFYVDAIARPGDPGTGWVPGQVGRDGVAVWEDPETGRRYEQDIGAARMAHSDVIPLQPSIWPRSVHTGELEPVQYYVSDQPGESLVVAVTDLPTRITLEDIGAGDVVQIVDGDPAAPDRRLQAPDGMAEVVKTLDQ